MNNFNIKYFFFTIWCFLVFGETTHSVLIEEIVILITIISNELTMSVRPLSAKISTTFPKFFSFHGTNVFYKNQSRVIQILLLNEEHALHLEASTIRILQNADCNVYWAVMELIYKHCGNNGWTNLNIRGNF